MQHIGTKEFQGKQQFAYKLKIEAINEKRAGGPGNFIRPNLEHGKKEELGIESLGMSGGQTL